MIRLKRPGMLLLLGVACLLIIACKSAEIAERHRLALKGELGLSCRTKEQCWEEVLAGNPPNPKFAIAVPPSMGLEYAKMARDRFGSRVLITRWDGYFIARSQSINPAFADALKHDPFILDIRPSADALARLQSIDEKIIPVPIEVRVRTSFIERAFSTQATVNKEFMEQGLIRAHRPLATEVFNWMEREVRRSEKVRAR
ncbi:MAG TPA: hypothetical protein VLH56_08395 [Dissulfurispiraceae bacterium]|nr:hypothetical protein [Dissulfurispiraceae bacterium]